MRLGKTGYPVIILSHRRREFLETAIQSLRLYAEGITDVIVVDDSGDERHHQWLSDHDYQFSLSSPDGSNVGYLGAMQTLWETAREMNSEYVLLWEEDFTLTRDLCVDDMARVMRKNTLLAQLNLQRQAVYRIERRLGYMESHIYRRYGLSQRVTDDIPWVGRLKPFTTNPGLLRDEVLDIDWPFRRECDEVPGGAEPAMSMRLEDKGWKFGWLGQWNTPHMRHNGIAMKTGQGY